MAVATRRAGTAVKVPEKAWTAQVLALASYLGWKTAHFRPAQNAAGQWRTPVAGDGKGFPDLVLVRDRVIFAELKTEDGKPTPEQRAWLAACAKAGAEAYVWRPSMLDEVAETLRRNA